MACEHVAIHGLIGNEIPLTARIVADVFDALTHERPYSAWSVEEAVDEIHRLSGSQFDPQVVAAFGRLDHHPAADTQAFALPPATAR